MLLPALPLFLTPNNNILLMPYSDLLKKSILTGAECRLLTYRFAKIYPQCGVSL
jgi:hypothetical protein